MGRAMSPNKPSSPKGLTLLNASKWLWKSLDFVMVVLLVAMIGLVFTNVVLRYGFSSSLRPSVELSRLGFVWVSMIGAAVMLKRHEHLAISEISQALFPAFVPFLQRLHYVVILVAMLMLLWGSFNQMNQNWGNISQLTGLPSALLYLAGVISAGLMTCIAAIRIFVPSEPEFEASP